MFTSSGNWLSIRKTNIQEGFYFSKPKPHLECENDYFSFLHQVPTFSTMELEEQYFNFGRKTSEYQ